MFIAAQDMERDKIIELQKKERQTTGEEKD
jgi:hypothetical protein